MLVRRRLLQLSIFDLLLLTAAVTALLVSYEAMAPRTLVYTCGFIGGLLGAAVSMNRAQPRLWQILLLGTMLGVGAGLLAALAIEALYHGIPFKSNWMWQFRRGRVPATHFGAPIGGLGGFTASALSAALFVFKSLLLRQRAQQKRNAEDERP